MILVQYGYQVLTATSADNAMEMVRSMPKINLTLLEDTRNRVSSLMTRYRKLYESPDFRRL